MQNDSQNNSQSRTLTWKGGGWVFLLVGLLIAFLAVSQIQTLRNAEIVGPHGTRSAESYGFDLSTCLIPRDELYGTDARKSDIPPLDSPALATAETVETRARLAGVYALMPSDRVIGIVLGDEARAYPLWVLTAHEVCNDELNQQPIAITYNPLCDSVVAFDRTAQAGSRRFASSGIVYNSNTLLFDRCDTPADESLWSQMLFKAVAGPAARGGEVLRPMPAYLVPWSAWRARYPHTTVALPDPARKRYYRPNSFGGYFQDARLRYSVSPRPSDAYGLKTPMAMVLDGAEWRVAPALGFDPLRDVQNRPAVYALWFAWSCTHPEAN